MKLRGVPLYLTLVVLITIFIALAKGMDFTLHHGDMTDSSTLTQITQ